MQSSCCDRSVSVTSLRGAGRGEFGGRCLRRRKGRKAPSSVAFTFVKDDILPPPPPPPSAKSGERKERGFDLDRENTIFTSSAKKESRITDSNGKAIYI